MNIFISAGEPSGDEHAAKVAQSITLLSPHCELYGMGGSFLRSEGVETLIDSEQDASIMGFVDVLKNLPKIRKTLSEVEKILRERRPRVAILVDYQDFHFQVAKITRKLEIPTLLFISPSIWAWRAGRVKLVKQYLDAVACIFPFEPKLYSTSGYKNAFFVGHPLTTFQWPSTEELHSVSKSLKRSNQDKLVLLMPGSRKQEVLSHLTVLSHTIKSIAGTHDNIRFVLPVRPALQPLISSIISMENVLPTTIPATTLMRIADCGLIKSGTSNLQAAFAGLPFAMFFKTGIATELIIRTLSSLKEFSIVNVIKSGSIHEYLQKDFNTANMSDEIIRLLNDELYRTSIEKNLKAVRSSLEGHSAHPLFSENQTPFDRVASLALSLI